MAGIPAALYTLMIHIAVAQAGLEPKGHFVADSYGAGVAAYRRQLVPCAEFVLRLQVQALGESPVQAQAGAGLEVVRECVRRTLGGGAQRHYGRGQQD